MISALVICRNEEKNIEDCLKSLSWVDELVVVDGKSTDDTMSICLQYTKHVYENDWKGFAGQRKFGLSKVNSDWVFSVDADERCTDELKNEILSAVKKDDFEGFLIPRKNFFLKKWVKHSGWYPNYRLILFKTKSATVSDRQVHEHYSVDGKTGKLRNSLLHYTVQSIKEYSERINEYSSLSAVEKAGKIKVNLLYLLFRPYFDFIQKYIFQGGFLDGTTGLMVAYFHFYTKLLLYMKIWELQKSKD